MSENVLTRAIGWLRAGYPEGIPSKDHVALLDVLARRLTPAEAHHVAATLAAERGLDYTSEQIAAAIERIKLIPADEEDVRRVAAHLVAGGAPCLIEPTQDAAIGA